MKSKMKQAEIEKAHVKSLGLIAGTFLIANVVLLLGYTSGASAQTIQVSSPAFDLAKMLAAPDISTTLGFSAANLGACVAMIAALFAMGAGSFSFMRRFARNVDAADRVRF